MSDYIDLSALGQVLLASVLAGAGLVACFALGIVGWSVWEPRDAGDGAAQVPGQGRRAGTGSTAGAAGTGARVAGLALAVGCFTIVVAGVAFGLFSVLDKS